MDAAEGGQRTDPPIGQTSKAVEPPGMELSLDVTGVGDHRQHDGDVGCHLHIHSHPELEKTQCGVGGRVPHPGVSPHHSYPNLPEPLNLGTMLP